MQALDIKSMQRKINAAGFPLVADGQWGAKSKEACKAHLLALMPHPHPWPAQDEASLTRFYGKAGDESNLVNLPVGDYVVKYDSQRVKTIRCHKLIASALGKVIAEIANGPDAAILMHYGGCYNYRQMRGGSRISTHAWGIAIDLAPNWNGNLTPWPKVATMPLGVCEAFARQGFLSAGPFWGRDGMHHQATR